VIQRPALADPEVAAMLFKEHLDDLWSGGRPEKLGWRRTPVDALHEVVVLPAKRPDGTIDDYDILLGAEYYDRWPPTVAFVDPDTLAEARLGGRWFPELQVRPDWFALHDGFAFPAEYALNGSTARQLVCFTGTAQYYMVDHQPPETTIWTPGRHTVSMVLMRLHEVLKQPFYLKPSG
jgi:hypothetical protein